MLACSLGRPGATARYCAAHPNMQHHVLWWLLFAAASLAAWWVCLVYMIFQVPYNYQPCPLAPLGVCADKGLPTRDGPLLWPFQLMANRGCTSDLSALVSAITWSQQHRRRFTCTWLYATVIIIYSYESYVEQAPTSTSACCEAPP